MVSANQAAARLWNHLWEHFGVLHAYRSSMTQPRLVVPGDTLMITRRTLRRHHLFRPDSAIRQLYLYALALGARQFGILVHAVTLMSTHEHLIVTDPQGRYPEFLRRLHRLVSLGTKVLRKWEGPTWDPEQTSVVRLLTEQAVIEKLAYVMANPVKAGLVRHARDWPGITVLPHELGRRVWTPKRPEAYFNAKNRQWPDTDRASRLRCPQVWSGPTARTRYAKPSKRSSSARSGWPTRRSTSVAGACSAPPESVDSRRIGVRRALSSSEIETRRSRSGGDRRRCSLRPWQSFAPFGTPTDKRSSSGVQDYEAWCFHRAPGACAECTASLSTRSSTPQFDTGSVLDCIGRGTGAF